MDQQNNSSSPVTQGSPNRTSSPENSNTLVVSVITILVTLGVAAMVYGYLNESMTQSSNNDAMKLLNGTGTSTTSANSMKSNSQGDPLAMNQLKTRGNPVGQSAAPPTSVPMPPTSTPVPTIKWEFSGDVWKATGSPPACPDPIQIVTPVDTTKVTSILYPGQTRGGQYKPHGGFRIDSQSNDVTVKAPLTGKIFRASRYIEQDETQYLIDIVNDCGIMYRLDHLLTLDPKFQAMTETLPPAVPNDSHTTLLSNPLAVTEGDTIATAVGFKNSHNVSFDFGLYDLRKPNIISQDTTWAGEHSNNKETSYYALCWLNYMNSGDAEKLKALPEPSEGKTSDYCK